MVQTIGNPLSWGAQAAVGTGHALAGATSGMRSDPNVSPRVNTIGLREVGLALRLGWRDFLHLRSDVLMLVVIYPIVGLLLAGFAFHAALLPLLFPLVSGFALLGPIAAIGLYAMSRHAETDPAPRWGTAFASLDGHMIGPVLTMGLYLLALFTLWVASALAIYNVTLGPAMPTSVMGFARDVLTTAEGWTLAWLGIGVGGIFALIVLVTTLTSLPMLIDRPVGLPVAVAASLRVARKNPLAVIAWGIVVAALLLLGSLPLFLGLIVVLPVLGHGTWHLYRLAIDFDD
ncbi:DUF2189 domain-containing protein [Shimia aestuarii]|uniref:DUF2189 domain-containing protein n=1 Tax=Shimia aestuarii TaxID=254406 RepID=UPI001FB471DC|nr:DUF2189 domain-containing protein [Shimia aestuarii]